MNDEKGCYNRIVHTVAILVLMSFRLSHTPAKVMFEILQTVDHNVETGFGASQKAYGQQSPPIQGAGQGNGCAPALWAMISSIMIRVMGKHNHGVNTRTSLSMTLISLVCFAFVDDTGLPVSAPQKNMTGEEVGQMFQEALDRWAGLLRATGGELAPEKSWCYIIDFKWKGNKWEYRTIDEMDRDFKLTDNTGARKPLRRLDVWEGSKTLRVFLAMDGNNLSHLDHLKNESTIFVEKMQTSSCNPNIALYTFKSCFLPKLEYCLAVCLFIKDQWRMIMHPAKRRTLQKAKWQAHFLQMCPMDQQNTAVWE